MLGDVTWGDQFELVGRLQKEVLKVKEHRNKVPPDPVNGLYVRASSLGYYCAREEALVYLRAEELGRAPSRDEVFDAETLWRFAIGHAIHEALQNRIMPKVGDAWQGWWDCSECGHTHKGPPTGEALAFAWIPEPDKCIECGCPELNYRELAFRDDEYILTGHIDGIYVWPGRDVMVSGVEVYEEPYTEVIDFKTVDPRAFRWRDPRKGGKPMITHLWQITAYMWKCGVRRGRLVYVEKKPDPDVLDNWVEFELELDLVMLESIKSMLLDTKRYFGGDKSSLPNRLHTCTSRGCKRAQKCTMRKRCWSV